MVKIARKTQKIFANNNPAKIGQFGSAQLATPTTSADLDVIQALAAYENGWNDGVLNGERRPPLEEFNGLKYVTDSQIAYLLQEGIAEYDVGTSYFINSIVKESGTTNLYSSITDTNIGNALTDITNWVFLGDLGALANAGKADVNVVHITQLSDFPPDDGTKIILEDGKRYVLHNAIVSPFYLEIPAGSLITLSVIDLSKPFVYLGTGAGIRGLDFGLFVADFFHIQAPAGSAFDLDGVGTHFQISTVVSQLEVSEFKCSTATLFFTSWSGGGILFDDRTDAGARVQASFSHSTIIGSDLGVNVLDFKGTGIGNIGLQASGSTTGGVSDNCVNFDPELKEGGTIIAFFGGFVNTQAGGNTFAPNSLRQDYTNANFSGIAGIANSTVSAKVTFFGNTLFTTITVAGQNEPVATNVPYTLDTNLFERMLSQDNCTFINGTDTANTLFNHGLILNDRVFLHTYSGTLPAELDATTEYFVVNPLATSFQLSLTAGGVAIDFTDDGSGVLFYRHTTGQSQIGQLIYIGNGPAKVNLAGWNALSNIDASDNIMHSIIMRIALDGVIAEDQVGSEISADNTKSQSSINLDTLQLEPGEGIVIYHRNDSNIDNILTEEILLTINKA